MKVRKSVLAVAAALVMLAIGSSAAARFISVSNTGFRGAILLEARSNATVARCIVTLEGTFVARTIVKRTEAQIGSITRATLGACQAGIMILLPETLPWPMYFKAYSGTLPTITGIRANVERFSFRLREALGGTCLFASETAEPVIITFEVMTGNIAGIQTTGEIVKPCVAQTSRIASAVWQNVTVLNETGSIAVSLI